MAERRVKVSTEVGIQARPATVFVETAASTPGEVTIAKTGEGQTHDAKSILQVLVLDVRPGDEIVLTGDDEEVLDRLVALVTDDETAGADGGKDLADIDER
ncbi:MAG: HPr family phosphocarrier protein [Glycomyces artemisiae]|uniref:HPr family phosphocarrier protein n=1 Tax=Glycomyces artemisiae TaxID=1076443 RepID=A0A2T0UM46_9ACTN|nr:HPr family phosphocarrier protein [Glycomyces artemisiae]NUQ87526.1 HPr family phosphocarrier protein [Glycomyces artemisiae]PRY59001.1 phosphocarrier protein HPr [Glycomyces artemisiae]